MVLMIVTINLICTFGILFLELERLVDEDE